MYRRLATAREFLRDYQDYSRATLWRYGAGGSPRAQDGQECLESRLTMAYHRIEKGASYPNPKRPYGLSTLAEIEELLRISETTGSGLGPAENARSAICALERYNATGEISEAVTPVSDWDGRAYSPAAISQFVRSRHSVRSFQREVPPDLALIRRIVAEASTTPSVCNRRSYRAHYFADSAQLKAVLSLQNGNSGFGHTIPGVFIVTVRRSAFSGAGERNQRWIDGGLFAMTLVWLCHAHGLGTCFLNWSQTNRRTDQLRELAGIPRSEDVITIIAVGHPEPGHRVARSPLRPESDTYVQHASDAGRLS